MGKDSIMRRTLILWDLQREQPDLDFLWARFRFMILVNLLFVVRIREYYRRQVFKRGTMYAC